MAIAVELSGAPLPEGARAAIDAVVSALLASNFGDLPDGQVNICLTDDAELQRLNAQFAESDYPTDVLSFSYIENGAPPIDGTLGDVAISLDMAGRQALVAETPLTTELALLSLHGILHVLGYDHIEMSERKRMDQIQAGLMADAGLIYRDFAWVS